jgi:hypothetical protein
MKRLFALLMCVAILAATFTSCDIPNVFDEIVETPQAAEPGSDPKPAEKIPSGFVFTPFEDGTCELTEIYLTGNEGKVITLPATSPDGAKVVAVNISCETLVPNRILKDTFEKEIMEKTDTLPQVEQMQIQNFFKHYSLDDPAAQKSEVIKNDWLKKYPIIEKEAIYAFTGATIREHVAISAILDKIGFDYKAKMNAVREVRELAGQLDATNEDVKRFVESNKYPMSFGVTDEIIVPEGVLSVRISGATTVKKITLPNGIEALDKSAFTNCSSLEQINIPDTVKTIGDYAFLNCETLNSLAIPATVTEIADNAFEGSGIRELIYGGTQAEWNENFADLSEVLVGVTVKCTDGDIAKADDK